MTLTPMGRVNVTTPGTPVALSTDPTQRVTRLFFQSVPGSTGKTYIGKPGMSKSTLSGVARVLAPNPSGVADQFLVEADDATDKINMVEIPT